MWDSKTISLLKIRIDSISISFAICKPFSKAAFSLFKLVPYPIYIQDLEESLTFYIVPVVKFEKFYPTACGDWVESRLL